MTQNKYDDPVFFEKYSQMSRSKNGLEGAGEWHVLQRVLPDFTNKTVLDLGCGYGWHSIYAIEHGAKKVIASDISSKMIETARIKTMIRGLNMNAFRLKKVILEKLYLILLFAL